MVFEVKNLKRFFIQEFIFTDEFSVSESLYNCFKVERKDSTRRIAWLKTAMKDVASNEMPWGPACGD